jgi:hypothetical protein
MQALRETTGGDFHPHVYILDGTNLVAYIRAGTTEPFYFKNPIKGFDRRGRKFDTVELDLDTPALDSNLVEVEGSTGAKYRVDRVLGTCTCPGFGFRGACKHVKQLDTV